MAGISDGRVLTGISDGSDAAAVFGVAFRSAVDREAEDFSYSS